MGRPPRGPINGAPFHVTVRGNDRRIVFEDDSDRRRYLSLLKRVQATVPFMLHHYALMDNHVHLLLEPTGNSELSDIIKRLSQSYSIYHGMRHGKKGHLWQGRYWSEIIDTDEYLLTCGIYIELNPVRAGIVGSANKYAWSSHGFYAGEKDDGLITPSPAYLGLGENNADRRKIYTKLTGMWANIGKVSDTSP